MYLVDVFVFEGSGAPERRGKVLVEDVGDPKEAAAALELDVVDRGGGIAAPPSVQSYCEGEVGKRSEEAPALVDAGLREKVEALPQPGLDACQAHSTTLFGQLVLRREVVSGTTASQFGKGGGQIGHLAHLLSCASFSPGIYAFACAMTISNNAVFPGASSLFRMSPCVS